MGNANPARLPLIGPLALSLANQIAQMVHAGSGADGTEQGPTSVSTPQLGTASFARPPSNRLAGLVFDRFRCGQ